MDIIVSDNWLRDWLKTNTPPKELGRYLSLSGPSVEKTTKTGRDYLYKIEVTTNRIDSAAVYGIAREAVAILPQFGKKATLVPLKTQSFEGSRNLDIKIVNNPKLCERITCIKLSNTKDAPSPKWMVDRLESTGQRSLGSLIDITNYVMLELGQPIHVFDYDKLTTKKIVVREGWAGEKLVTLDNKVHTLRGGEIVFDNGEGEIIDLPGIMGTKNSVVGKNTKNVLLLTEVNDPVRIRETFKGLNIRTQAAVLNEKGPDPELAGIALRRGIELFIQICKAKPASKIYDYYPNPYMPKFVRTDLEFINKRLSTNLRPQAISQILKKLGFGPKWKGKQLIVKVPSFRANDIAIPEDIVEEVARIHGYHNLDSLLMTGPLPEKTAGLPFDFERKVKEILKALGGVEVYTFSLVDKSQAGVGALKIKNPLGAEGEYLRTSLRPSLKQAAITNKWEEQPFHLFEVSAIYLPQKASTPQEQIMLAGIFTKTNYRVAKGITESLLTQLGVGFKTRMEDSRHYRPSSRIVFSSATTVLGELGVLENGQTYYEFNTRQLQNCANTVTHYTPIPKHPPQIEDLTLRLQPRTLVGEVLSAITTASHLITNVELVDVYGDALTFRIRYQHPQKTLTDTEVEGIRNKIVKRVSEKFGASVG